MRFADDRRRNRDRSGTSCPVLARAQSATARETRSCWRAHPPRDGGRLDSSWRPISVTEPADLTVAELLQEYAARRLSPIDAVESCLARIDRLEPKVGAVLTLLPEGSLEAAQRSSARWRRGEARPLDGVPYGLKDIIDTRGIRTTGGSALYESRVPDKSATVHKRLERSGAVLVAKLQTFEFAAGANSATSNPWDPERTAAGSSSGPAAAVASRELPFAIGTDTSGSITVPSAFVGITGMKPTYGRVPRSGVMPLSWTLDHVGPMARTAVDVGLCLQAIGGWDNGDPMSSRAPMPRFAATIDAGVRGLRIGLPEDWFLERCDPEVRTAVLAAARDLEGEGAVVVSVGLPATRQIPVHAVELTITYAELAAVHSGTLSRFREYGPEFQRLLTRSQFVLASDYLQALRTRHLLQRDFERVFASVDALLVPGAVCVAPRHDHMIARLGPDEVPLLDVITRTTAIFDITGLPTLTMPSGFSSDGLPMAVSIAARPFSEGTCLRIGSAYQRVTAHHERVPELVRRDRDSAHTRSPTRPRPPVVEYPVSTSTLDSIW
jgi:aspartyl-tRNA(Asn)/glutamyl-tRNA(Gln) amidotransferase subunit A